MKYWEPQSGGLCRKHAINCFLGGPKITDLHKECKEFDDVMRLRGYKYLPSGDFDSVSLTQETVMSYFLWKNGVFTTYIAPGYLNLEWRDTLRKSNRMLVFNAGHIWCVKREGSWFNYDSLGGGVRICSNPLSNRRHGFGFVIEVDPADEFKYQIKKLICFLKISLTASPEEITAAWRRSNKKADITQRLALALRALTWYKTPQSMNLIRLFNAFIPRYENLPTDPSVDSAIELLLINMFRPNRDRLK